MIDDTLTDGFDLRDVHSNSWYIYLPSFASYSSPQGSYMYVTKPHVAHSTVRQIARQVHQRSRLARGSPCLTSPCNFKSESISSCLKDLTKVTSQRPKFQRARCLVWIYMPDELATIECSQND
jgi:hypothetical protein